MSETKSSETPKPSPLAQDITGRRWGVLAIKYVGEFFEAVVILTVLSIVTRRPLGILETVGNSLLLGFVTLIIETLNENYRTSIKNGLVFAIGSGMTTNAGK